MELLPLPNFYHTILFSLLLFVIGILFSLLWQKRPKLSDDIYELSQKLNSLPQTPKSKKLLKELEPFKYKKNPPPPPFLLIKRVKKEIIYLRLKSALLTKSVKQRRQ